MSAKMGVALISGEGTGTSFFNGPTGISRRTSGVVLVDTAAFCTDASPTYRLTNTAPRQTDIQTDGRGSQDSAVTCRCTAPQNLIPVSWEAFPWYEHIYVQLLYDSVELYD